MYEKNVVRELLIDSTHGKQKAKAYFEERLDDKLLLDLLVEFALDDYSTDASMTASYWISQFSEDLLRGIEENLLVLQQYELNSISVHALVALGKIQSTRGLRFLLENKIAPKLHWEAVALEYHLKNLLNT
ncbi:hypothetical protein [Paenibacillus sp. BJ-4]|uniref:hypothetical protein n=1 Tax=Paenibacillus sp. BJ-4 TaxID=2878097 RepID=UPI001CF0C1A3|nr:hypothetical protein [Paenibacillus sp. BJ-4]